MPAVEKIGRRNSIPILYTRGTHYEVGFDVVSESVASWSVKRLILNVMKRHNCSIILCSYGKEYEQGSEGGGGGGRLF